MFKKYLDGLKPLRVTAKSNSELRNVLGNNKASYNVITRCLHMGERTRTAPIGYRNTVVLSKKGNTAPLKQGKKL